jgi:hypothetical protein
MENLKSSNLSLLVRQCRKRNRISAPCIRNALLCILACPIPLQSHCPIITNTIVQSPKSPSGYRGSIRTKSLLKDAVHDIAADGSARTKNGCIAHFFAELLAILFELAGLPAFCRQHGAGLADG